MADETLIREEAAHEQKNWVRLTNDCNNHCVFCLDTMAFDGTVRPSMEIKAQIVEGRKRGATRLILSGGEPTIHPHFLDFVKLGRRAGYRKVQTVTNGRMFKYPEFLNRAADNGLDEITFSLHGHTAKLHDALVGTPGAFVEETAGLKAALASGRFIVNVDIVINKQNVKHLPEMLETFIGWGVKEFDLLHVIPFGNAWSLARDHLFYDLDGNLEHLQKAFAYARRPDIHIWLNRFPPPYAEGFEDLVEQDGAAHREVGPPRIHAGHGQAFLQVGRGQALAQLVDGLRTDAHVAQVVGGRPFVGHDRHQPEAEDGARRSDDPAVAALHDLSGVHIDLLVHVPDQPPFVAGRQRIRPHEPLCQPDRAHLETARVRRGRRGPSRDLDAAAADVDDDPGAARQVGPVRRRQVNEPGLFGAGDHPRANAGRLGDGRQEIAAVRRLSCRRGRGCDNLVHVVRVGQALELRHRRETGRDGVVGEALAIQSTGAEADHVLLAVDHLEREIGTHLDDDHVDGVGADVDGG